MENSYKAVKGYQIFSIEDAHVQAATRVNGLVTVVHRIFVTADEAEQWIPTNGARHLQYTILEVFKKP